MSDFKQKFWLNSRLDDKTNCLNWQGTLRGDGYGVYSFNGRTHLSHRLAWSFNFGRIPKGKFICHRCDNRKCVNPEHLFLGSYLDNINDKVSKGRQAKNDSHGSAKVTSYQVQVIRFLCIFVHYTYVAKWFNLSKSQTHNIKIKRFWKDIPDLSIIEAAKVFQQYKQRIL